MDGRFADNLAHGVVEGQVEDLDKEVDGIAGQVALGPAPIAVLDDETGISGQDEIAGFLEDELESLFCEKWGLCAAIAPHAALNRAGGTQDL